MGSNTTYGFFYKPSLGASGAAEKASFDTKLDDTDIVLNRLNSAVINIKAYGAVGDGVTNDSTALGLAIDAAITASAPLYIPAGTYYIPVYTKTISSPLTIIGDGKEVSILASGKEFVVTAGGFVLKDLQFLDWTSEVIVTSSSVSAIDGMTIQDCKFDTCIGAIYWRPSVSLTVLSNVLVSGCTFIDCRYGIWIRGKWEDVRIVNNHFEDFTSLTGTVSSISLGSTPTDNATSNTRAVIGNNIFSGFVGVAGSEAHCIIVYGSSVHITENTISNCFTASSADHEAIYLKGNSSTISDNILYEAGNGTSDGWIALKGAQYSYDNTCSNNILVGTAANSGIYFHGSGIIADNKIKITTSSGISVYAKPALAYSESQIVIIHDNMIQCSAECLNLFDLKDSSINNNTLKTTYSTVISISKLYESVYPSQNTVISNNYLEGTNSGTYIIPVYSADALLTTYIHNNRIVDTAVSPSIAFNTQESAIMHDNNFSTGDIGTLANDATPSVHQSHKYWLTGGTTTITDFDDGYTGQVITIISEHSITITDGTNIFLSGSTNFAMAATDTLTLICKSDGKWYEIGRSDNT